MEGVPSASFRSVPGALQLWVALYSVYENHIENVNWHRKEVQPQTIQPFSLN